MVAEPPPTNWRSGDREFRVIWRSHSYVRLHFAIIANKCSHSAHAQIYYAHSASSIVKSWLVHFLPYEPSIQFTLASESLECNSFHSLTSYQVTTMMVYFLQEPCVAGQIHDEGHHCTGLHRTDKLCQQLSEHRRVVRTADFYSFALAEYVWSASHPVD